ncbi:MAG: phosphoribosylglycinamide formyltransferase, partial [Thermoguttaceae bacterium]|nr:phosphoribosylglycinamide formyltransferase [Thermoguttaceae bacterium]
MAAKLPIAVLISGTGRTLKNLLDQIEAGKLDVDVRLVVSRSDRAKGLQFAEQNNIPIAIV